MQFRYPYHRVQKQCPTVPRCPARSRKHWRRAGRSRKKRALSTSAHADARALFFCGGCAGAIENPLHRNGQVVEVLGARRHCRRVAPKRRAPRFGAALGVCGICTPRRRTDEESEAQETCDVYSSQGRSAQRKKAGAVLSSAALPVADWRRLLPASR
jgi:hypothetical protein